jgi:hypothetical protein
VTRVLLFAVLRQAPPDPRSAEEKAADEVICRTYSKNAAKTYVKQQQFFDTMVYCQMQAVPANDFVEGCWQVVVCLILAHLFDWSSANSSWQVAALPEPLRRRALFFDPILPPIHPRIGAPREFPVSTRLQPHWIEEVCEDGGYCQANGMLLLIGEQFEGYCCFVCCVLFVVSPTPLSHKSLCCAKMWMKVKIQMTQYPSVLHSLVVLAPHSLVSTNGMFISSRSLFINY